MENSFFANAISTKLVQKDAVVEWGPGGFFAIASEHIVTIYRVVDRNIAIFRTISRHKSNITKIAFNHPTVEISNPDSFAVYIAVADEAGNCLIYDINTGKRHSGISPDINGPNVPVLDLVWSTNDSSTLFILTQNPALICFTNGTTTRRRSSFVEDCSQHGLEFKSFNMTYKWSMLLKNHYSMIAQEPFEGLSLLLASRSGQYIIVELKPNSSPHAITQNGSFPDQSITNVEYFPNAKGKIVVSYLSGYSVFDIATKESIPIYSDTLGEVCPVKGIFSSSLPNEFWTASVSGTISRFTLKDGTFFQDRVLQTLGMRVMSLVVNPFDSRSAIAFCQNSRICILRDDCKRIIVEAMIPETPEIIVAWEPTKNGIVYATNTGLVVIYIGKQILKFDLQDAKVYCVFYKDNQIIAAGSKLYFIDLEKRIIKTHPKYKNPQNVFASKKNVALCPFNNVIDIIDNNNGKLTCLFADTVRLFVTNDQNPSKLAVFINNTSVFIIDASGKDIKQTKVPFSDAFGEISAAAFSGERLIALSTKGILYNVKTDEKISQTISFSEIPLKKVRIFESKAIIIDNDNTASLIDLDTMRPQSFAKWKVLDAQFISDSFAMIQTSPSSIRIVQLPSFETFAMKVEYPRDLRDRFIKTTDPLEMEQIAFEAGDLNFVQIARVIRKADEIPNCGILDVPKNAFSARFACTSAIDRLSHIMKQSYVDYLILTGNFHAAAEILISEGNENSALFAHACLSPNKDAAKAICKVTGLAKISGRLLALAGEKEEAVNVLKDADLPECFTFLKMLFNEEESFNFIESFVSMDTSQKDLERLCAFVGDGLSLIPALAAGNHVSLGRLAILAIGKNGTGNIAQKLHMCDYEIAQNHIEAEWQRGCSIIPDVDEN